MSTEHSEPEPHGSASESDSPRPPKRTTEMREREYHLSRSSRCDSSANPRPADARCVGIKLQVVERREQSNRQCAAPSGRRTRNGRPRSTVITAHPCRQRERTKTAAAQVHLVPGDCRSIPLRPRKYVFAPPPPHAIAGSGWGDVGGAISRPSSPGASSVSTDTDDLMERDAVALELRAQLEQNHRERLEYSRRLLDVEAKMRKVRDEMSDLRQRQRDRREQIVVIDNRSRK